MLTIRKAHLDYHQRSGSVLIAVVPLPRDRQLHADHQLRMDSPPPGSLSCRSYCLNFIFIFGLTTILIFAQILSLYLSLSFDSRPTWSLSCTSGIHPLFRSHPPMLCNADMLDKQEMNREQTETGVSIFSTPLLTLTGSLFSVINWLILVAT